MQNNSNSQKTILNEAFISFSGMTAGSVFRYLFSIIMARFLGAQMLGIYSLSNAILRVAEIFALSGLDNGVLRFVSRDVKDKNSVENAIFSSIKTGLITSLIISIILFFNAEWIVNNFFNQEDFLATAIKVFSISLPFSVMTLIASHATQAFKILKYKIFVNQLVNPFTLLIGFIFSFLIFGSKISILIPTFLSSVIGFLFIMRFLRNFIVYDFKKIMYSKIDKDILRFSIPLMFVSAIGILMHWIDILMLGYLSDTTNVGMYHPIDRTAGLVRMILFAFAGIFAPIFSEKYFNNDLNGMSNALKSSTKSILFFSTPIFIFLFVFSQPMLLLFGSEFNNSLSLKVLLIGIFAQTIFGLGSSTLTMSGYTLYNLFNVSIALIINIVLNFQLIPSMGILGAAFSTTVSLIILSILRLIENLIILKLNILSLKMLKPIFSGFILFSIFNYLNTNIINFQDQSIMYQVVFLVFILFSILLTFFVLNILLGLDEDEKIFFKNFKNKILS